MCHFKPYVELMNLPPKTGTSPKSDPNPLTIAVEGDLVSTTAAAVRREIDRLLVSLGGDWPPDAAVKLDLTRAKMIDSVGLNLVVGLLKAVQKQGGRLQVAYADANVSRTLTFTRLDKQLELVKV
jgi:anti-anti-sigma factor